MDYIVLNYEVVVAVGMEMMWSAYSTFMQELSLNKQRKILAMFGPTVGTTAEIFPQNSVHGQ